MQLTLKSISHPDLKDISISSSVFSIGRGEEPFSQTSSNDVNMLSRRHAKLFFENGHFYVVDLGSKNGTKLNGESVGLTPVPITNNAFVAVTI